MYCTCTCTCTVHVHVFLHDIFAIDKKDEEYGTRHQEAVKIFNALLSQETLADPIKVVQNILYTCFDIVDLQSEVSGYY